jgi:hypothetical protein
LGCCRRLLCGCQLLVCGRCLLLQGGMHRLQRCHLLPCCLLQGLRCLHVYLTRLLLLLMLLFRLVWVMMKLCPAVLEVRHHPHHLRLLGWVPPGRCRPPCCCCRCGRLLLQVSRPGRLQRPHLLHQAAVGHQVPARSLGGRLLLRLLGRTQVCCPRFFLHLLLRLLAGRF